MITAVVAALAALAGVVLGRILDVWSDSRRWLREYRSIGYAAFLGSAERYLSGALVARGAQEYRSSEQGMELDRTFGHLQVFGSEGAYLAAARVRETLLQLHAIQAKSDRDTNPQSFLDMAEPVLVGYRTAVEELRSTMKKELRVR
jgi:hypothetical protein